MRHCEISCRQARIPAPSGPLSCLPAACSRLLATCSSPPFTGAATDAGSAGESRTTAWWACADALRGAPKDKACACSRLHGGGTASQARSARPRRPARFPSPFASLQCSSRNLAATIQKLASASARPPQAARDDHFAPTLPLGTAGDDVSRDPLRGSRPRAMHTCLHSRTPISSEATA
jgi:hypothetical protein